MSESASLGRGSRALRIGIALVWLLACAPTRPAAEAPDRTAIPEAVPGLTRAPVGPPTPPARVLLVSIAGLTPQAYLGSPASPPMPVLGALAREGAAAQSVEGVAPPAAYPAHTTLVTGVRPGRHGVPADRRIGERGVRRTRYWHASHVRGSTLWQRADQAGIAVAALDWPATVGAAIPLLLPDIAPTRRGETWLDVLGDTATPWLRDFVRERADPEALAGSPGAGRDAILIEAACAILETPTPPGLLLLRLSGTAPASRRFGPESAGESAAFAASDALLERLLGCLARRGLLSDSALVVVGDGAFRPVHTAIRANAVLAEAGLIAAAHRGVRQWKAFARSNGGSAFVYARSAEGAVEARRALEREAERTRAFAVVPAEEMIRLGADPEAWFGLAAEPGFVFSDRADPPALLATQDLGAAGYLADVETGAAGLVAWGRGVRPGVRIPRMRQTDVAPTVARLLGVELPATEGRVLIGALRVSTRAGHAARGRAGPRAATPPGAASVD